MARSVVFHKSRSLLIYSVHTLAVGRDDLVHNLQYVWLYASKVHHLLREGQQAVSVKLPVVRLVYKQGRGQKWNHLRDSHTL